MELVLCIVLIVLGVLNLSVGMLAYARENDKIKVNRSFFYIGIGGFLWCFGYALMGITKLDAGAYIMRSFALAGVFFNLGYTIKYVQQLSGFRFVHQRTFDVFKVIGGIVCWILVSLPYAVRFTETPYGKYYISNPWIGRYIQYLYILAAAIVWFSCGISWYRKAKFKREIVMSRNIITSGVILCVGMIFDTIVPLLGKAAFPTSAISTFFFILMLYKSLKLYNDLSISSQTVTASIFKNVAIPVIVMDAQMVIVDCNEYACEYFDEARNVLLNSALRKYMLEIPEKVDEDMQAEVFNQSDKYVFEATVKKNSNICNIVLSPVYDRYGQLLCFVGIMNDVTQYMRIQKSIDESDRRAAQANVARHTFFKGIDDVVIDTVHKNLSYYDKLLDDAKSSIMIENMSVFGGGENYVDNTLVTVSYRQLFDLQRENRLMLEKLENLNDLAHMESNDYSVQKQKYDIGKLLEGVIAEIADQIEESRVKFITQISPSIPQILIGDEKKVRKILYTFLQNSIRYTRQGYIKLYLSYKIRFGLVTLQFKVSDTGIGMSEDVFDNIFGEFDKGTVIINRNLSSDVGTGLGLAVCRNIIKLMNGEASIQSAPGTGTTFEFSIEQKTDSEHSIIPYGDYKHKVLFLEEMPVYVDAVSQMFKELGIPCEIVSDRFEEEHLPDPENITLVLVSANLKSRFGEMLEKKYTKAKVYPVYSYKNYKKLRASEEGVCGPLLFSQVADLIK